MKSIGLYNIGVAIVGAMALFSMTGCAAVREPLAVVGNKVAGFQCGQSARVRALERWAYAAANDEGRFLVGFCPTDEGYDEAKEKYIDAPNRINKAYWEGLLAGDTKAIIKAAIDARVGGDTCITLSNGWTACPKSDKQ